jgi:hypothetical protein
MPDESGFRQANPPVRVNESDKPLPELFTPDEWRELKEFNQETNRKIHNAWIPKTSAGRFYIILPHKKFNEKTIKFCKSVALKGDLIEDEEDLEIKDEAMLSGSSGSEKGSP